LDWPIGWSNPRKKPILLGNRIVCLIVVCVVVTELKQPTWPLTNTVRCWMSCGKACGAHVPERAAPVQQQQR
jgi:ribosomal protein S12